MPVEFSCPHCGHDTIVSDQYAGQTGACAKCGEQITIPSPSPESKSSIVAGTPKSGMGGGAIIAVVALACAVLMLLCGGVLVALLLPGIQFAKPAARRSNCSNNMKQIALAFHNYHDTYGTFPPAYIPDENGKPKHSWRVLILPFLEQANMYAQYDFDEPWDSPANSAITQLVVPTYNCPSSSKADPLETNYMLVTGPNTVFDGSKSPSMAMITDGTSNTILIVEVTGAGVQWAEPTDLDIKQFQAQVNSGVGNAISSEHPGGANVSLCDGSVRFLPDTIDAQTLQNLINPADGQVVNLDF